MDDVRLERKLSPQWAPELVVLSCIISWLGAYTSTQIMIHAKYTSSMGVKWLWTFCASIAFGFCAIWSMHFVGMLACRLDVDVRFDVFLTILSAVIAVFFTFAALASPYASEAIDNSTPMRTLSRWNSEVCSGLVSFFMPKKPHDPEVGYAPLQTSDPDERTTMSGGDDLPEEDNNSEGSSDEGEVNDAAARAQPYAAPSAPISPPVRGSPSRASADRRRASFSLEEPPRRQTRSRNKTARQRLLQRALGSAASGTSTPSGSSTTSSSESSSSFMRSLSGTTLATTTTTSSSSWGEPLRAGLSRETRLRIKARAKERPLPDLGWRYWARQHYKTISIFLFVRAAIWAAAIVFMHYCGMWAMILPEGRIAWDLRIVALSYVVAFSVCFVGSMFMVHMESHIVRQMIFSTIAAIGCCSMHYTGMAAATFYSYTPPSPTAGYPAFLPFTIVGIAVSVCVVSNAILAHAAVTARNRMAEMILTKRRLWRIMAEKEAAEQAIELKQQFISVASHEIRTPLHTVNGYCELLARTDLTEEQSLYVTSIQQACHAINVIAGNVLDFSKLDRNNVELSARPVHMEVRKMMEDIAKITEARGVQPGAPGVDVIVWIARDVPRAVYLDETYAFRILMNLLSNAQKFCEQGYICLSVSMSAPAQLRIEVSDTGCGIPQGFRAGLFQPFQQADTSHTRPHQGTGLGLSIVKHLVQRMSGTVDVESVEGEGATFIVQLPVTLPSRSPSPTEQHDSPPQAATKRLRVVYRNPRSQEQYLRLWSQYGYKTSSGSPLSSAEELAKDVDTIWTDAETVSQSSSLRGLIGSPQSIPVTMFIVHSDGRDLSPLEPELNEGKNVVLVKRPVIMHTVMEWIESPGERMGAHIKASKVRFALPPDDSETSFASSSSLKEKEPLRLDRDGDREDIPMSPVKSTAAEKGRERPRVLLVEDNLVNQRLGCRLLEKLGYDVTTANDGQQAIAAVRQSYFVCCLMDCQMPILDGFQATKRIRELEQSGELPDHLPILALTANVTQESEGECRAAGMDLFLPKPLRLSDLEDTLRRVRRTPHS
ncbi:hypothetical protein L226DRAFT_539870 [Lentinus tigrinus ALCF2SS1-7]|uniref:uncharacterized protein n=1 Tax=Lentinus tigrinus ALCF2SS1-7 TaxID=1328758 RepID=UPI0011661D94|nr:hypothetical protein L226DRAFT_539870 [Lentinus tigrinus ALCF2SS1-7]